MRRGSGFSYVDARGAAVTDPAVLERIRALVIPPAWNDVWICPSPRGHVQAVGVDEAGRRQYRYHDAWSSRRAAAKWRRSEQFGTLLPAARDAWSTALAASDTGDRERCTSLCLRLLDRALLRVGSTEAERRSGTHGLTTLRAGHVNVEPPLVILDFVGKSAVHHRIALVDDQLAQLLEEHLAGRDDDDPLLGWRVGGRWHRLCASEVNDAVRAYVGAEHTAKDFRTWHGTVLGAASLAFARRAQPDARPSSLVPVAAREVALVLGNTPAVCRSSYIDPRVFDAWSDGRDIGPAIRQLERLEDVDRSMLRHVVEQAVLDLLAGKVDETMRRHAREVVAGAA